MAALSTAVAVADQLSVHRPQVVGASNCDIPSLTHNPRTGKLEVSDAALGGRSAGTYQYAKPMEHSWQPYELNGGSVVALAGDDFAVIAADTRLSRDYSILSRNVSKLRPLNSMCVVGTGGCWADVSTLHKILKARCVIYENDHEQEMSTEGCAQMLSNTLYGRRFFPYYAFNIVAGLDKDGKGAVYGYDAVGSYQRDPDNATSVGSATNLIVPVLDNIRGTGQGVGTNRTDKAPPLTLEDAVNLIKDCFITAGERDIKTGDAVEIMSITKDGMKKEVFELKKD